jgi:DNA-binding MarR family transcriptional regulator
MIRVRRASRVRNPRNSVSVKLSQTADHLANSAARLIRTDELFKTQFDISALRPAARLLLLIAVHRSCTIKEAMLDSPLSYRSFYVMLDNLKGKALVSVEPDGDDRRVRRLVLGSRFRRSTVLLDDPELP